MKGIDSFSTYRDVIHAQINTLKQHVGPYLHTLKNSAL